jgi:hypothetical protein
MRALHTSLALFFCVTPTHSFSLLRTNGRQLQAVEPKTGGPTATGGTNTTVATTGGGTDGTTAYVGGQIITDSTSYTGYDQSEVLDGSSADKVDSLRSVDQCYKDGSFSDCSAYVPSCDFTGVFGSGKLCINRLPTSQGKWYVAAMKCIPHWENCDKCMCGIMTNDSCVFEEQDVPNDDQTKVDCSDLGGSVTIEGITFSTPGGSSKKNGKVASTPTGGPDITETVPSMLTSSSEEKAQPSITTIGIILGGVVVGVALIALVTVKIVTRRRNRSSFLEEKNSRDLEVEDDGSDDESKEKRVSQF